MNYQIARGIGSGWPKKEYTFDEIISRARREGKVVRDGYGRSRLRNARKLVVSPPRIVFIALDEPEEKVIPFGAR